MPCSSSIRWAGVLPEEQLFGWSLEPMVRIAHGLQARHPKVPIIAFPRAVGPAALMYRRAGRLRRAVDRHRHRRALGGARNCSRRSACRAISIRSCWWPAATRWSARPRASSTSSATARSSSISAMAWCRRRRPTMSRTWSRSCATGSRRLMRRVVKIAIILFNLGGPDSLEAVQPFLRNLFSDPAIICACRRFSVGRWRASSPAGARRRRGRSTTRSAAARRSSARPRRRRARWKRRWAREHEWRGYVCMRYWHPMTEARGALGEALRARSHRAAAALSAILDHHDGIVVQGLERQPATFKVADRRS